MGTYQLPASINRVMMKAAVSSLANVKSPQNMESLTSGVWTRSDTKRKPCRCFNDVCEAAALCLHNDLIRHCIIMSVQL